MSGTIRLKYKIKRQIISKKELYTINVTIILNKLSGGGFVRKTLIRIRDRIGKLRVRPFFRRSAEASICSPILRSRDR